MRSPIVLETTASSNADRLGYLGQQAVAHAVGDDRDYRIVGGHMVRLLLQVYPTDRAVLRSTIDADAAVDDIAVIGAIDTNLLGQEFVKTGGNVYVKGTEWDQRVEINLLLARRGQKRGLHAQQVTGVGQVDTLPELGFAMLSDPLILDLTVQLSGGRTLRYSTRIPDLEVAVVLKAHSWHGRRSTKDLADLASLFEIREAYPETAWKLGEAGLIGFRKDSAKILHALIPGLTRMSRGVQVPDHIDRLRLAALITKHVAAP